MPSLPDDADGHTDGTVPRSGVFALPVGGEWVWILKVVIVDAAISEDKPSGIGADDIDSGRDDEGFGEVICAGRDVDIHRASEGS